MHVFFFAQTLFAVDSIVSSQCCPVSPRPFTASSFSFVFIVLRDTRSWWSYHDERNHHDDRANRFLLRHVEKVFCSCFQHSYTFWKIPLVHSNISAQFALQHTHLSFQSYVRTACCLRRSSGTVRRNRINSPSSNECFIHERKCEKSQGLVSGRLIQWNIVYVCGWVGVLHD